MNPSAEESFRKEILVRQRKKIEVMKSCRKPYSVELLGKKIVVFPSVFYPAIDTKLLITAADVRPDETVLEPCAGTGAISIFLAEKAKQVVATDVNPAAVRNIEENARKHRIQDKIRVYQADLFPRIKKKFDVIVINPPYTDNPTRNFVEQAFWDEQHKVVKRFFKRAARHLAENGRIFLSWANFAGFDFIENLAKEHKFVLKNVGETTNGKITFRVYEIKKSS